jgi:autotransporter-associated beta strand protein
MPGNLSFTAAGSGVAQISGTLNLGTAVRAFTLANGEADNDVTIDAVMTGTGGGLTTAGAGRLVLSGNSGTGFTGATTVGGTTILNIQNGGALGTIAGGTTVSAANTLELQGGIAVGAEALSLNGTGMTTYGAIGALRNVSGNNSWGGPITLAAASRINSDSDTLTLQGAISGATIGLTIGGAGNTTITNVIGTTSGTLIKDGAGTLTLSGANTFTGATTVNGGTLVLDYSTQNNTKLADGVALNLYKGTLTLNGGSHTEVVGSTTLNAGSFAITRSSGNSVLRMNGITRAIGSTIDFATNNIADTDTSNFQGILGISGSSGYATVGSNTWAVSATAAADTLITGLPDSGYVSNTLLDLGTATSNCNVSVFDTYVLNNFTINSIRFNETAQRTLTLCGTLTVTSGGILNTATVGANTNTITGATLTSATDLKIHQYNTSAPLRIDSPIYIANTMALTKSGPGTLILGGGTANTFAGNSYVVVNGGELDLDKSAAQAIAGAAPLTINQNGIVKYTGSFGDQIGTGAIAINENGQLDFNGASDSLGGTLTINSTGASGNTTPIKNSGSGGNLTWGSTWAITPLTGFETLINSGTGTNTLGSTVLFYAAGSGTARISGNLSLNNASRDFSVPDGEAFNDMVVDAAIVGGGASGALTKSSTGRLVLSGNNSYDGLTTVNGTSILNIQHANALGSTAAGTVVLGAVNVLTTLELQGGIAVGTEPLTLNGLNATLRNISGTNSWAGPILVTVNPTAITCDKDTLTISGDVTARPNVYLVLNGAGDIAISGALDIPGGLTKNGTGTLTLSGANKRLGGPLNVSNGKLVLDYTGVGGDTLRVTDVVGPALTLAKCTLDLTGSGSATQVVGQVTLNAGQTTITRSSGSSVLRMNQISRTLGGTVDFAAGGIADTDSVNVNGILASSGVLGVAGEVGFATVAGASWAVSGDTGTDLTITDLPDSGYVINTALSLGTTTSNCDVRVQNTTITNTISINSIRFNEPAKRTLSLSGTLTVTSGGILNTATVGANTNTITGISTLTSGLTDLKIHQYNTGAPLRIDAPIGIALTKSGPGTLILGGFMPNAAGASVVVNGGELDLDKIAGQAIGMGGNPVLSLAINQNGIVKYTGTSTDMIGNGSIAIYENGQLDFNGKSDTLGNGLTIVSTGANGDTTPIKNSGSGGNLNWGGAWYITPLTGPPMAGYRTLIDSGTGTNTLGGNVNLNAAGSGWAQISGNLSLSNAPRDFAVADGDILNELVVDATITGGGPNGALSKSGTGRLVLGGNNDYVGLTTMNNGFLQITNGNALGTTAAGATVNNGTTLELLGNIAVGNESLTLNGWGMTVGYYPVGALRNVSGNNTWNGPVTLGPTFSNPATGPRINSDSGTLTLANTLNLLTYVLTVGGYGNVTLSGAISGAGQLNKEGLGTLTIAGASANNNLTNLTYVTEGTLVLAKTAGVAVSNLTLIGSATYNGAYGRVRYAANSANPQIGGTVTLNANANGAGQLDFNGSTDTIAVVTINSAGAVADSRPIVNTGNGGLLTINALTITPVAEYITQLDSGTNGVLRLGGNVNFVAAANESRQAMIAGNLDLNGTRIFNVQDPGTARGPIYDLGISAVITNGSLTKTGTGTTGGRLYLSGVSTYTGTTLVQTGTVIVAASGSIAASANVTVNTNAILQLDNANALGASAVVSLLSNGGASKATLNLNFAGIQTVGRLYLDGVNQRPGVTYGSATSGAMYTNSFFTGPGLLMAGGGELSIVNLPVTAITTNSATFNGSLWATGTAASAVCVLWGTANGGQSWSWQNTNWFNGGEPNAAWGNNTDFSTNIAGLPRNTVYYYTYAASNSTEGVKFATPSVAWGTAEEFYVSTNGTQSAGCTTWATAYTNLQAALASTDGRTQATIIYVAGQTFSTPINGADATSLYVWQNATNCSMLGGYRADPVLDATPPGVRDSATYPTVLRRTAASGGRRVLKMASVANAVIEQVTIREGYNNGTSYGHGSGVLVSNCQAVTLSGCSILNNTNTVTPNYAYGAGVGVQGSDVVLTNCTVADNDNSSNEGNGGGLWVDSASRVTTVRSFLLRNRQYGNGYNSAGPAFYNQGNLRMFETVVANNWGAITAPYWGPGGGGWNAGILLMQNCLVVSNKSLSSVSSARDGDGIQQASGAGVFVNCTFANNNAVGIKWGVASQNAGGTIAMTNCIVWGHSTRDLLDVPLASVWYSGIGDGQNNGVQGCTSVDPLFADTTYFHLKSTSTLGTYTGGYFTGGTWVTSASDSPLIDFGYANSPYSREPAPNGNRINMGYDGNTEVASMTVAQDNRQATVANLGATLVGHRSAVLNGQVTDTGYPRALTCFRYWAVGSGPTTETARVERQLSVFSAPIASLTPGTPYQYVVVASNVEAEVLSAVASFSTHPTPSYLYVATNGNNTAGTDWTTAYTSVQTALNLAEPGDTICLAGHTFAGGISIGAIPAFPYNKFLVWQNATNVTVKGGYRADPVQDATPPGLRNSTSYPTILKRTMGSVGVLGMVGVTNCTIEQVTFREGQNARQRDSAGVYVTNCWATFDGCAIVFNTNGTPYSLAGLYVTRGFVVLTNSTIADNYDTSDYGPGCGLFVAAAPTRVRMIRSSILRNKDNHGGNITAGAGFGVGWADAPVNGGLGDTLELIETVVAGNQATGGASYGGGGFVHGTLYMQNCLVVSNYSSLPAYADGIHLYGGTSTFVNCTFATNYAKGIMYGAGTVAITNSIIWGHTVADLDNFPASVGGVLSNVAYSCFGKVNGRGYGDSTAVMANDYANSRCITNNPLFVDAAAGNFRLQSTTWATQSLGINAGLNDLSWMMYGNDLAGQPRILNVTVDMGAYENAIPSKGTVLLFR